MYFGNFLLCRKKCKLGRFNEILVRYDESDTGIFVNFTLNNCWRRENNGRHKLAAKFEKGSGRSFVSENLLLGLLCFEMNFRSTGSGTFSDVFICL